MADLGKLDPQAVLNSTGIDDDAIPDLSTVRDQLLRQLYDNRKELKGIALVQGLKAIATLVGLDDGEPVGEATYTLVDLLADVNLPLERKHELLTAERDHHLAQLELIEAELGKET